ncbi:MAG TPA: hypothetical protein VFP60_05710 [Pseudolabrys sp.]|nr:hypothetical protein [Pseudolabrys sp.]
MRGFAPVTQAAVDQSAIDRDELTKGGRRRTAVAAEIARRSCFCVASSVAAPKTPLLNGLRAISPNGRMDA